VRPGAKGSAGRVLAWFATLAVLGATAACGIPTSGTPTAIAKADVPFHLLDPATPTTLSPILRPDVAVSATIYLVAPTQHLIAVNRDVQIPATLSEILGALLEGPTAAESAFGLQSFLTGTTTQVKARVAAGIATVDFFSANPVQVVGPDQTLAIAQVVFTATQQPGVKGVVFQIDNRPIEVPTARGVQVPGPVTRASYLPQAPRPSASTPNLN
jgi:spore germination protein GerM